jgi:hypothetical protein
MFVRFRETKRKLQLSIVETRRVGGKIQHEHVASLGSIAVPPSIADRVAFWTAVHQRLAKLSNRIDAETQGKLLGAIHARVPMVTPDEQRTLQLENAEADERFWSGLQDMHATTVADHKNLVATAQRMINEGEAEAEKAGKEAETAKQRIERIKNGENVTGGLGKPFTYEDYEAIVLANGFTKRDLRRAKLLADLGEEDFERLLRSIRPDELVNRVIEREARALLKRLEREG